MKKKVFFGGSFDPLHMGHYEIIKKLSLEYETVIVVLSINYLKKKSFFSYEDRISSLKIVVSNFDNVSLEVIDDQNIVQSTYLTAKFLENKFGVLPDVAIGSDCLNSIEIWKDFDKMKYELTFYIFKRNDDWKDVGIRYFLDDGIKYSISSSDIRKSNDYSLIPQEIRYLFFKEKIN